MALARNLKGQRKLAFRCSSLESCKSPLKPDCGSRDIAVYIVFGGKTLPVCRKCWDEIAETDLEWGEEVSKAKLERSVEEAKRQLMEKLERGVIEEALAKAAKTAARKSDREHIVASPISRVFKFSNFKL